MTETIIVKEPVVQVQVTQPACLVQAAQPGLPGPPGSGSTDPAALHVSMRLAEFDTPEARAQARANLELQYIDCGTF